MRGGEEVSRQAHNLKNGGASPSPATKNKIYNIIYLWQLILIIVD